MIPKRQLEDIRFRNDIVDIIGGYISVKKAGSTFKALCPFHKEKTPSFNINQQKQIFHCFGCGEGGDVFAFVMKYEGMDFTSSAKLLAHRAGIALELEEGEPGETSDKPKLFEILSQVADLYHHALLERTSAAHARTYIEKRGLTPATVESFKIGYAPDRWDAVLKWAEKNHIDADLIEKAGLIIRKTDENSSARSRAYDRFRNRLMFPITDEQGRVIGFSGRSLDDADKGAKYVNSPETPLFHKSRILYAMDKARQHIASSRQAIVCEGQIDVIRCHQAGMPTAVASQGTAFTEDHVRILRRYADSVVIAFDPDTAGQNASIKAAIAFMTAGLSVRVATFPTGMDPDSFIAERGADAFTEVLANAQNIVGFQISVLSQREKLDSEVGTMRVARAILETINHSPNSVQRAKLLQDAAERLNIPQSALQDDLRFIKSQQRRRAAPRQAPPDQNPPSQATPDMPPDAAFDVPFDMPSDAPINMPSDASFDTQFDAPPANPPPEAQAKLLPDEIALCEHAIHIVDCPEMQQLLTTYLPPQIIPHPFCRLVVQVSLRCATSGEDIQDVLREHDDSTGSLSRFAAHLQMSPNKTRGKDMSRTDAVQDIILRLWCKKFQQERNAILHRDQATPSKEDEQRRVQLTYHLKSLQNWQDGQAVIELEMMDLNESP